MDENNFDINFLTNYFSFVGLNENVSKFLLETVENQDRLQERNQELENINRETKIQATQVIQNLENNYREANSSLNWAQQCLERMKQRSEEFSNKVKMLENENEDLKNENHKLFMNIANLEQEKEEDQMKIESLEASLESTQSVINELEQVEKENINLRRELEGERDKCTELQSAPQSREVSSLVSKLNRESSVLDMEWEEPSSSTRVPIPMQTLPRSQPFGKKEKKVSRKKVNGNKMKSNHKALPRNAKNSNCKN